MNHMSYWLDDAVFYEIYPQSFQDTNSDGIGDFQGIIQRLDYIRSLGCNAIWMNPCFVSPFHDAGYDVADYYTAAPRYGTNDDLKRLFAAAHERGMHVILDLVPGHTSIEHPWFQQSALPTPNPYTDRYIWTDNVWEDFEGIGNIRGSLRGYSERDGSCAVNFYTTQPALNFGFAHPDPAHPWQQAADAPGPMATRQAMKDVMRFWLSMGCDGFRVDMAASLIKNDPDASATIALWQDFRAFLDKEFPDAVMVSEWGQPDQALTAGFHMDFLLHFGPSHYNDLFRCEHPFFSKEGGDVYQFAKKYQQLYDSTGGKGLICIPSGNHDMERLAWKLDQEEIKIAFAFLLSMPGAPFIYYGDEIGMRYLDVPSVEGGSNRTGARSPMQWDCSANAGFSCASPEKLYIPIDPSEDRPTVASQQSDPHSLYHEVKKLLELRHNHSVLQSNAAFAFVYAAENRYPLVYTRRDQTGTLLIAINPSSQAASCPIAFQLGEILYENGGAASEKDGILEVPARSASYIWIK